MAAGLVPAADVDARITVQLIRKIAVPVPLHLSLIDGQDVPVILRGRDDVPFPNLLLNMRPGHRHIFVIGVIRLSFLFNDRPFAHGRAKSQRPDRCTHN
jgi:hypothetical protein